MILRATLLALAGITALLAQPGAPPRRKIQVLIITGRDSHDWRGVTPVLRQHLEGTGLFEVRIAEEFRDAGPESLNGYDVAVLVYSDKTPAERWSDRSRNTLLGFVRSGKGLVVYHHSATAFLDWPEFARLSGGSYDRGAQHSPIHDFNVELVDREHPITRGLKATFHQPPDELYAHMQMQPAGSFHVLANAWDDHALYVTFHSPVEGPGQYEPLMWTVQANLGRVFATMIGHSVQAIQGEGFRVTFTRGVEWAATGAVTQPAPPSMAETRNGAAQE